MRPFPILDSFIVNAHTSGKFQHQRCRVLRDGIRAVSRDIGHHDIPFRRRLHINNIESCCQDSDEPEIRKGFHYLPCECNFVHQQAGGALRPLNDQVGRCAIMDVDIAKNLQSLPVEISRVQGKSIENYNFFSH